MLVTLPPGMVAKGFELNKGFQPKGLLKGTEVALLVGGGTVGAGVVTVGADLEGFGGLLRVLVTGFLGLGIAWLLGLPIIGVELKTSEEYFGELKLVTIGINPIGADFETDVGAAEDISWLGVI